MKQYFYSTFVSIRVPLDPIFLRLGGVGKMPECYVGGPENCRPNFRRRKELGEWVCPAPEAVEGRRAWPGSRNGGG